MEFFPAQLIRNKWVIQSLAAMKIQRSYRKWRVWVSYHQKRLGQCHDIGQRSPTSKHFHSLQSCFHEVISEKASFEQKMTVWRGVIDLRRLNLSCSSDIVIKALIEAEGEFNRANAFLSSKEFLRKHSADLPSRIRILFLPLISESNSGIKSTSLHLESNNENGKSISGRVQRIRSLRQQLQRDELMEAVDFVVSSSYFSKGNSSIKVKSKK